VPLHPPGGQLGPADFFGPVQLQQKRARGSGKLFSGLLEGVSAMPSFQQTLESFRSGLPSQFADLGRFRRGRVPIDPSKENAKIIKQTQGSTGSGMPQTGPVTTGLNISVGEAIAVAGATFDCETLPSGAREVCRFGKALLGQRGTGGTQQEIQNIVQQVPAQQTCPQGTIRFRDSCVDLTAAPMGGDPFIQRAGGVPVEGAFGFAARTPFLVGVVTNNRGEQSAIRRCSRGSVLGQDDLCYPKSVLPRRNKFRKHKGAKRPPMTAKDASALARIGTLRDKVKDLASDAGMSCSLKGSGRRKKKVC